MSDPYSDDDHRKELISTAKEIRASSQELIERMSRMLAELNDHRRKNDEL